MDPDPRLHPRQSGRCSITGGYVYRGCIPSLQGHYFYGDFCSGRVWSFQLVNGRVTNFTVRSGQFGLVSSLSAFGEDHNGELLMISLSGTIYRVESRTPAANDLGFGTPGSNGDVPAFSVCGGLAAGESAELRLDGAVPNSAASLLIGTQNNPTMFPGLGTFVPIPVLFTAPFVTDAQGKVRYTQPGGTGAATAYTQWAIMDPGAPNAGVASSNALEIFLR